MKLFNQYKGLRKEVFVLFFGVVVTSLGSMIYPVLTLILSQKMGMSATQVALVTVISGILVLPSGIIGGKIADRCNKKKCIIACDCVSIVLFIICGLTPLSYLTLGLLILASGFQNLENPVYNALIADITTTKDREKAYSLTYLGHNLGQIASPTIAGILFKNYLWLSFIISGVSLAMSTILIFFKLKDITPVEEHTLESEYQVGRADASLIRILRENKLVTLFVIANSIFWAAYAQNCYILPLDLGQIHGENGALIFGSVYSINCFEVVLLTPILTKLLEKVWTTGKIFLGESLVLIGYILFRVMLGQVPFYYVAMTMFTVGEILVTISMVPFVFNRVPASHRGRVNGFVNFLQNFIYGTVMLYVGRIYDQSGSVSAWMFVFVLLGIAMASALILIFWDRKRFPNLYRKE